MVFAKIIIYILTIFASATAMFSAKEMEGYPTGYLSDCPGSTKKAIISPASLKNLLIVTQGPESLAQAKRRRYNYYQMKQLAKDPVIDFKRKTFFFVAGYLDSTNLPVEQVMSKLYADRGYNTIMLDTNYFTTRDYPIAARYMRPVGFHAAEMLANLTSYGLDPKKLTLLGLSLGGQTMSFIAKSYRELTGMNISRLIGLDPSGPCFRHLGPDQRLDSSDADFVQVVSTNIDGFGMAAHMGHVTFYINGGEYQPGDLIWYFCLDLCSHIRAYTVWMSALHNPKSFIGIKCDSVQQARERNCYDNVPRITNVLGPKVDTTKHGIFYLATHNFYPFFMGEKGLIKTNDYNIGKIAAFNNETVIKL